MSEEEARAVAFLYREMGFEAEMISPQENTTQRWARPAWWVRWADGFGAGYIRTRPTGLFGRRVHRLTTRAVAA